MLWPAAGVQVGGNRGPNRPSLSEHMTANTRKANYKNENVHVNVHVVGTLFRVGVKV